MKTLAIIAAFLAVLIGLALAFPDRLLNPGHLMQGHAGIEKQCLSCHKPFRGALAMQCASCHKPGDIGIRSVDGSALPKKAGKALFHRGLPANGCLECHTDHKGRDAKKALRTFRHESLGANLRANCNTCHDGQKPQDKLHDSASRSCGDCHATGGWRPASFDHKLLTTRQRCIECHKRDLPTGGLHASAGTNCTTCHGTKAWKPASFNHDRYFRLDRDHRASCATCHNDPTNFRQYTCYGCHEHTPANIASEHIEEGIRNYRNCAKCHKNSRDGD
ncbi:hypothetical protein FGF66_10390 [Chlorobaculum thiosulfatiphilum]|uniref:Cytochrome c7-like domain-containing protein n=1 Tax=Chlorobaculum thiosulfatiphilum TaxID=115852 RepID=A0A5C4S331_CHLTI|nr:cytochrome c3 family protein [Chlorobaculum thiosulfatiphilum]TNJ37552.1 hypothetical protein FGF66_10390 [Chlorobaculum thiosulfatiphilum]